MAAMLRVVLLLAVFGDSFATADPRGFNKHGRRTNGTNVQYPEPAASVSLTITTDSLSSQTTPGTLSGYTSLPQSSGYLETSIYTSSLPSQSAPPTPAYDSTTSRTPPVIHVPASPPSSSIIYSSASPWQPPSNATDSHGSAYTNALSTSLSPDLTSSHSSTSSPTECATYGLGDASVSISTVFPSTITFTGRPEDFHPNWTTDTADPGPTVPPPCSPTQNYDDGERKFNSKTRPVYAPITSSQNTKISASVWVTTAKTPAVKFVDPPPPDYSLDPTFPPPARVVVTNDPTGGVTIGTSTFSDIAPGMTTTVKVGRETFTIGPTAVTGPGDVKVERPVPVLVGHDAITTSTVVGGVPVQVTASTVVVEDTTVTMTDDTQLTVVVTNQGTPTTVEIGPGGVTAPGSTLTFPPIYAPSAQAIVAGGELLTAIGPSVVVIRSTTFTYGPGIAPLTQVLGTDSITIGPSGVRVHGIQLGGSGVATGTDGVVPMTFEVVGGVTLTEADPSQVVVAGTTLTIGPGVRGVTTLVVGTETVTAGEGGVTVGSMTITYPLGPTVVSTVSLAPRGNVESVPQTQPTPSKAPMPTGASGDGSNQEDGENGAGSSSPTSTWTHLVGIMVGIMFL